MFRSRLDRPGSNAEDGFTLIELLVVVVIIGILIAIAMPVYMSFQRGAADRAAAQDLRHAVMAMEKCNLDNGNYGAQGATDHSAAWDPCSDVTITLSSGTTIHMVISSPAPGPGTQWSATATNSTGSKTYTYDSTAAGSVKAV